MRILVAAAVALVALAAVGAAAALLSDDDGAPAAGVRIASDLPGVAGVAFFDQRDERLTGYVALWGLEPGSRHAVHFHGPDSACGTKADPVAVHPDLEADANGVAYTTLDLEVEHRLVDGGFYYNVHEGPSSQAENPEIACADIP